MLPLENLTVHAFRGLREVELSGLGRLNLLVGPNNSGKTSVLEAIATYARPLSPSEWVETARRREITPSRASLLEALRWMFPQPGSGTNGHYEGSTAVSAEGRSAIRRSEASLVEIEGYFDSDLEPHDPLQRLDQGGAQRGVKLRLNAAVSPEQQQIFDQTQSLSEEAILWERSRGPIAQNRAGPSLPVVTITPFSHRVQRLDVEALSEAIFEGIKHEVLDLVRIFDGDITDLQVLQRPRAEPTVYVRHQRLGNAPLSSFGDGMRRLLLLGVTLATVRGGVLLVDEIESAIHVEALDHAFRWLRRACAQLDVQLFASTHSLEAVDALLAARDVGDDLVLFRLTRQGTGTRVTRLQGEELRVLREDLGQEVRA